MRVGSGMLGEELLGAVVEVGGEGVGKLDLVDGGRELLEGVE